MGVKEDFERRRQLGEELARAHTTNDLILMVHQHTRECSPCRQMLGEPIYRMPTAPMCEHGDAMLEAIAIQRTERWRQIAEQSR